jgi:hypothetical protein
VLGPSVRVGDFITTPKVNDVWWKVLAIVEDRPGQSGNTIRFRVVNQAGYERELNDPAGAGRRFYRWVPGNS